MSDYDESVWDEVVHGLEDGWSLSKAAKEAGVTPYAARARRKSDETFDQRCAEAEAVGVDRLEDLATERAIGGDEEDVVFGGVVMDDVKHTKTHKALMDVIERRRPRKGSGATVQDWASVLELASKLRQAKALPAAVVDVKGEEEV
jgi:hypothetical protein